MAAGTRWSRQVELPVPPVAGSTVVGASGVGYTVDGVPILEGVDVDVTAGEVLALVGPNGAGKSTLLGVLAGDLEATGGSVELGGRAIGAWSHLELARHRSVLTQETAVSFPFRVAEVVAMGRSPWYGTEASDDDHDAISAAMDETDVVHLSSRRYTSLSGGEKARVSLARVLAQRTGIVFLDEPTAALDLKHQEDVMRVARALARAGRAVVVVLHDLSLAGAYADRVAILSGGRLVAAGAPAEVFTPERLEDVYGVAVRVVQLEGTRHPLVVPVRDDQ
ncbi:heme ABC transporter ATP-binding protein [Compostimonas suwonensis]|uniref:Iron complex transport system ATP-binding protein n=1 Tax=Compostimonas suwonensis TaxID=1048394 RepID=A0A2M9C3R8_9MICO|nr:heme ABC transporter ATP-binding protein [Compostimonas suwonensis]PJJ65129.1 iron complex transport system ATP-binding protein [Compostimonas suwonensis]